MIVDDYTRCPYNHSDTYYNIKQKYWRTLHYPQFSKSYINKFSEKKFSFCTAGFEIVSDLKEYDFTFYPSPYQKKICLKNSCPFLKSINIIAYNIKKSIKKKGIEDSEILPYYYLHELIKKYPVREYDSIIRGVLKYVIDYENILDYSIENNGVVDIDKYWSRYKTLLQNRIKKATVIMCMQQSSCAYKVLVKDIKKLEKIK